LLRGPPYRKAKCRRTGAAVRIANGHHRATKSEACTKTSVRPPCTLSSARGCSKLCTLLPRSARSRGSLRASHWLSTTPILPDGAARLERAARTLTGLRHHRPSWVNEAAMATAAARRDAESGQCEQPCTTEVSSSTARTPKSTPHTHPSSNPLSTSDGLHYVVVISPVRRTEGNTA
jgi:hypothetical protein